MKDTIQTFSGKYFSPMNPDPDLIDVIDIAHSLSNQARFSGHTRKRYSTAEHSVRVSRLITSAYSHHGLLHDASEAYLVDIPRPLKQLPEFAPYREAEEKLQRMIYQKFGLDPDFDQSDLHYADRIMLRTEQFWLMPKADPMQEDRNDVPRSGDNLTTPWDPDRAKMEFLSRFFELWGTSFFVRR